jgi:hypothetical protein
MDAGSALIPGVHVSGIHTSREDAGTRPSGSLSVKDTV